MDAVSLAKGYYITADKDIAVIWDWETEDITEVPLTSSTTRTFTHTYGTNKKRRIYIAEKIDLEYIRIVGGADIASQTVSIKDLPSLLGEV